MTKSYLRKIIITTIAIIIIVAVSAGVLLLMPKVLFRSNATNLLSIAFTMPDPNEQETIGKLMNESISVIPNKGDETLQQKLERHLDEEGMASFMAKWNTLLGELCVGTDWTGTPSDIVINEWWENEKEHDFSLSLTFANGDEKLETLRITGMVRHNKGGKITHFRLSPESQEAIINCQTTVKFKG